MKKGKLILKVAAAILVLGGCTVSGSLIDSSSVYAMKQGKNEMIPPKKYNNSHREVKYCGDELYYKNCKNISYFGLEKDVNSKIREIELNNFFNSKYMDSSEMGVNEIKNNFINSFYRKIVDIDNGFNISDLCESIVNLRKRIQLDIKKYNDKNFIGESFNFSKIKDIFFSKFSPDLYGCLCNIEKVFKLIENDENELREKINKLELEGKFDEELLKSKFEHEIYRLAAKVEVSKIKYYLFESFIFEGEFIDEFIKNLEFLNIFLGYKHVNELGTDLKKGDAVFYLKEKDKFDSVLSFNQLKNEVQWLFDKIGDILKW